MGNFLEGMFGKIDANKCKLSMNGDIAIKTSSGYKTFDAASNKLTNCDNFVFSMGNMDMFFLIPTNKVEKGDIIVANGAPKCVIEVNEDKSIKCLNYETSVVENILPDSHIFMGDTYFYGKIVSMFGNLKKTGGTGKIFKYMLMSEMMKGSNTTNGMANVMPMMMMMNGGNFFGDIFDFAKEDKADADTEDEVK